MDSENNIYDGKTPVHSHPTEYQPSPNNVFHHQRVRIIVGIVSMLFLFGALYIVFAALQERETPEEEIFVTPTPSSPSSTPTIIKTNVSPSPTKSPTTKPTATTAPKNIPAPTATSVPAATNTPQPTATPIPPDTTPPIISAGGPGGGQTFNFTAFCFPIYATDNQSKSADMTLRYQFDSPSWTDWGTEWGPCFQNVSNGQHTFSVEVRDKAGNVSQETKVFTINSGN